MEKESWKNGSASSLLAEFFAQDDLNGLAADAGALLDCPLLVLDDTFHITAHYRPLGFSDPYFCDAIRCGEVTYEAGVVIRRSEALSAGTADFVKVEGSPYRRRFAPLVSAGVRLGYLICVDTDGHLQKIPPELWRMVEQILAKQAFIEASRQDRPFETAEDVLMHLLDGGFSSAPYFRLQAAGTYLADFHPSGFALIDLSAYRVEYLGKRRLKDELSTRFPRAHAFLYRGDVFLFLNGREGADDFAPLAGEFGLKIVLSDEPEELYALPALYRTAREALELMCDDRFHGGNVCTVAQLRTPLLLKNLEGRRDLVAKEIRQLALHDRERGTQYCETLYHYLTCCRSLKKTCDALFTHRNTVLYRIRRIEDDFGIPLEDAAVYADLLLGVSLLLFEEKGPDFFLYSPTKNESEASQP